MTGAMGGLKWQCATNFLWLLIVNYFCSWILDFVHTICIHKDYVFCNGFVVTDNCSNVSNWIRLITTIVITNFKGISKRHVYCSNNQGRSQGAGEPWTPIVDWVDFFTEKNWLCWDVRPRICQKYWNLQTATTKKGRQLFWEKKCTLAASVASQYKILATRLVLSVLLH